MSKIISFIPYVGVGSKGKKLYISAVILSFCYDFIISYLSETIFSLSLLTMSWAFASEGDKKGFFILLKDTHKLEFL